MKPEVLAKLETNYLFVDCLQILLLYDMDALMVMMVIFTLQTIKCGIEVSPPHLVMSPFKTSPRDI